ncbi:cation transporter, partial [Klebsiella pneumoniae]
YALGKKIKSDAIIVNAYEHRSDVFSSIAACIGIVAAMLGETLHAPWLVYADPVAGLFVSLLVLKVAWQLGAESIHHALDHVWHEEETVNLREAVLSFSEVKRIDSLYA